MGVITEPLLAGPARLTAAARPAVLDHLLALDADDRYGRFATSLSDAGIAAYAAHIDFTRDLCFGMQEADGELSGFIHLAVHGTAAELGASVSAARRRQGRARALFRAALGCAFAGGIAEIHLATGHPAARHICAGLGCLLAEGTGHPRVVVRRPAGRAAAVW